MTKGLKALESLMNDYYEMCEDTLNNDDNYQKYNLTSERAIIEKELNKPQQLYDLIKQKRANARLNYNYYCFKDKELKGQIDAYNDILSLMENMFEELENE